MKPRKEAEFDEDEAFYPKDWLGAAHYTPSKAESEEPVSKKLTFKEYVDELLGEDTSGMTVSGNIAQFPMGFDIKKKPTPEETAKTGVGLTGAPNRRGLGGSNVESKKPWRRSITSRLSESVDDVVSSLTEEHAPCPECGEPIGEDGDCHNPKCSYCESVGEGFQPAECTECGTSMGYGAPAEESVCPGCKKKKLMDGNQCSSCGGEIPSDVRNTSGLCPDCQQVESVMESLIETKFKCPTCDGSGKERANCHECGGSGVIGESITEGETPMSFSNRLERVRSEANLFVSNTDALVKKLRGDARVTMPDTLMAEIDAVWTSMVKVLNTLSDVKVFEEPKEEVRR